MTLIWPAAEHEVVKDKPRLHAFIIGVGDYPHLNGGDPTKLAADPLGLSQVTTPRYTAPAIAKWLFTSYNNPTCPLGSVEVLVSPSASVFAPGGDVQVESATKQHIKDAFGRWEKRCSAQSDDIALFYFCGHGLSKTDQFLLPEDFGNPQLPNQWENCFNFSGMRVGMRKCAAQTQLFFIDACRETPFGMLTSVNVSGDPLIAASIFDTVKCSAAYYATGEGKQAFGPDKDVTYFGTALLSCLNGVAALNKMGKWVVDTYSLSNAIGQVMAQLARRSKQPLSCNPDPTGMARIHEPNGPRVFASVECTSDAANNVAQIMLNQGAITIRSEVGQPKPIIEEVDAGDWAIVVNFPGGEFAPLPEKQYKFMPPVFEGVPIP
jgi:hypothetical protein